MILFMAADFLIPRSTNFLAKTFSNPKFETLAIPAMMLSIRLCLFRPNDLDFSVPCHLSKIKMVMVWPVILKAWDHYIMDNAQINMLID